MNSILLKIKEWSNYKHLPLVIIFVTAVIMFFLLIGNVKENKYDITEFQLSPETIRAVKTMEDPVKTEEEREKAALEVLPKFEFQEETADNQAAIIRSIFDSVMEIKKQNIPVDDVNGAKNQLDKLKKELDKIAENANYVQLSDDALSILLNQAQTTLKQSSETLVTYVKDSLNQPIRMENIPDEKREIEDRVKQTFKFPKEYMDVLITIARFSIVETEIENKEQTKLRIEQAKASVEPTRILQGQILVQKGEIIDREVYRQLKLLGMVTSKSSFKPLVGVGLFVLLTMWVLYVQTTNGKARTVENTKSLLVIAFTLFISVLMMKVLQYIAYNFDVVIAFIFPTAIASMLVYLLVNERMAFITTIIISAYAGFIFQEGYTNVFQMEITLYILFGGIAGIIALEKTQHNSQILRSSLIVSSMNIVFILFYLLMTKTTYGVSDLLFYFGAAVLSGVLSGALTIGILPFFESVFGILSTMKLIELSNPNHPLLKKILTETPGTYHHSVMVANLAETACEAIGANGLLARVSCYYHDIGKTKRPGFFIENQLNGYNPHDNLPPEASRDIISAHATDGANILRKHKMPKEIVDVAEQHHGTSLLKFFYHKAKEQNEKVREEDFRYDGPKPQSKEAAIISVADSVEAAVRSMKEPNAEKIQALVKSIIKDKLQDGQFDECDLSLREIKIMEESFCTTLNGIFHSRIEYPK
ncbi:HD family phosphohydrolase [Psychrobacillus vulpis]|uniref:HD family phosphohydrolase n=1 Tax=Psychrobacillus vulpis TaxID=2325572 RepID=A0A544TPC6_9BACI|nr:HD family phosphohydrolase [Psychrobacillus vulpis]TQR19285.1 HD family phosphohydrolase [Psychrobacillus vulpis]